MTVFCLLVWPAVTSARIPVISENVSSTSLLALPSRGGALTRRTSLLLHWSKPSGPDLLERGETRTSTSRRPSFFRETSAILMAYHMFLFYLCLVRCFNYETPYEER